MKTELLMPAGSLEKMNWAFRYGADAVYAGVPLLSLRARENEFNLADLQAGIEKARTEGKKFYLTANIFARNLKLKSFRTQLDAWARLKPDAMIMSDPGLISIAKEQHPDIPIHLSVQANCMNWESVRFWQKIGVSRVILSRELRLNEIKEIRDRVPDIELEAFVHGSICIAYSGRCLLSHYMSYRDANQGVCDNSCRYPYRLFAGDTDLKTEFFLQDLRAPDELYPIEEDSHGTYIMNSKDLCLIEHLKEIKEAGVCSFKVEGRTKSEFYAAWISRLYRKAIDLVEAEKSFEPELLADLELISNRGYHKGFMMGNPTHQAQDYIPDRRALKSKFLGFLDREAAESNCEGQFDVRAKLSLGQKVRLVYPDSEILTRVESIQTQSGEVKGAVHSGAGRFKVRFSESKPGQALVMSINEE